MSKFLLPTANGKSVNVVKKEIVRNKFVRGFLKVLRNAVVKKYNGKGLF
jgi:hypothetical protein